MQTVAQTPAGQPPRQLLAWLEIGLPVFALAVILWYYRPDTFVMPEGDGWLDDLVGWSLRILAGALGGILALFALLLAFCLLYSPVYLARNLMRALTPGVWVDREEFLFYLCCFGLLCFLLLIGFWSREAALVAFTVLSGSAPLLTRFLL
jgi:hypothetical protein